MIWSPYLQYLFIHMLQPSIRRKTVRESHLQQIYILLLGIQSLVSNQIAPRFSCGRYDVIKPLPPPLQIYPPRP